MMTSLTLAVTLGSILSATETANSDSGATVWTAPSVVKIFRDDKPRNVGEPLRLFAAQNEVESGQLVITAGEKDLVDVTVTLVVFKRVRARLPRACVELFLPSYIHCPEEGRDIPDPLPPLREPFTVPAGASQPVWIDISVPKHAPPGPFTSIAIVCAGGEVIAQVAVELMVYPFALPDDPGVVSTFGIHLDSIYKAHGIAPEDVDGPEAIQLHQAYYEYLLAHKISPYALPVDIQSRKAERYLRNPHLTSFVIPYKDDEAYLRETAAYLRENGWLEKAYFYVVDEPINAEQYARIKEVAERLHRVDPGLRLAAPFYRAPDWDDTRTTFDELTGYLDIWCPNIHYFDTNPRILEQLKERQAASEDAWCYVCCGPGSPYNNYFLQMDGFAHRLLYTQLYRLGVPGLLYWSTTYWAAVDDPWTNMCTVPDINKSIYGDGSLLYPGNKVGINGPVGSIRLKLVRDGIEDYQYLSLLADRKGEEAALRAAGELCSSLTDYCHDADQLAAVRAKIAREIME